MIYYNINISNKFVDFKDVNLDFSKIGIYLIKGENGAGKSTLIKSLVFGKHKAQFKNPTYQKLYDKKRYKLISYVSQTEISTPDNVREFLTKENKVIENEMVDLLEKFDLKINMNQPFDLLSGGEKMKLAIISALLKQTPYLFLDEPTNSLDDKSVNSLIEILKEYGKERIIIIVSHDPRISEIPDFFIEVKNNQVNQKINALRNNNTIIDHGKNALGYFQIKNIFKGMRFKNIRNWLLVLLLGFSLLVLLNHFLFYTGYARGEMPEKNEILVQSVDRVYSSLNQIYTLGEGLDIDNEDYYNLAHYKDVKTIANISGVEKIYLKDNRYYGRYFMYYSDEDVDDFYIFSIPKEIYNSEQKLGFLSHSSLFYLELGRLPKDNLNEVALSFEILHSVYDYDLPEDPINNIESSPIGDSIIIDNHTYTIVGILINDIAMVSYNQNDTYGIYEYSADNYDDFMMDQMNFLDEEQSHLNIDSMLITTKPGYERKVLNEMITNFPGNNYDTNYFSMIFYRTWNRSFNNAMYIANIGISILLAIVYFLGTKSKIQQHYGKIIDYQNYYLKKNLVKGIYLLNTFFNYIIIIIFGFLLSYIIGLYTNLFTIVLNHLVLSYLIIIPIIYIFTWVKIRNVDP